MRLNENIKFAMFPAVSARSIPATMAIANVAAKRKNSCEDEVSFDTLDKQN